MSAKTPYVSICLPVYNGENYICEAVQSVLQQTFADLELIITDNASTDGTAEFCREFAAQDSRVRYFRADFNRGLAWNWNRGFSLASGRYVMWLGHDDRIASDCIGRCVDILDQDPQVVLCYSDMHKIDENGQVIGTVECRNEANSQSPSERFKNLISLDHRCEAILGLMRAEVLKQTRLHGAFADSDRVLLSEMTLRGRFCAIPACLFSRREHSLQTTQRYASRQKRTLIFNPALAGKTVYPHWREFVEFVSAVHRAGLPPIERVRCYKHLLRWVLTNRRRVSDDLAAGLKSTVKGWLPEYYVNGWKSIKKHWLKS